MKNYQVKQMWSCGFCFVFFSFPPVFHHFTLGSLKLLGNNNLNQEPNETVCKFNF